jgi:RHS repeat-associated protein
VLPHTTASARATLTSLSPGACTVWAHGYAPNAAGDSAYVSLNGEVADVTGFAPGAWTWQSRTTGDQTATLRVAAGGVYTVGLWMREDGLRVDRILLTTDTAYLPAGFGPAETARQAEGTPGTPFTVGRTIAYGYDDLYRLTGADYSTGETYAYQYGSVGNRLQQIVDGDTTSYQYECAASLKRSGRDAANRLTSVNDVAYTWDDNGNLLATGAMTNTWDAANRLTAVDRPPSAASFVYNGVGDRVGQTVGATSTHFTLDVQDLPEVIQTSDGNTYLHLPGVIVAENTAGERRYLLADGLGSIRQGTDEAGAVVFYDEFDPYGNPAFTSYSLLPAPYAFTGEWWEAEIELLYLRARWYDSDIGRFVNKDPFSGFITEPRSLNRWTYGQDDPITAAILLVSCRIVMRTAADRRLTTGSLGNLRYIGIGWRHRSMNSIKALSSSASVTAI